MKECFDDIKMVLTLHLLSWVIFIAPKNKDGKEIISAIVEVLENQIEKK